MDHKNLYKGNALLLNKTEAKKQLQETRRNRRLEQFNTNRVNYESTASSSNEDAVQAVTKTRKDLLLQWREKRTQEKNAKVVKKAKPFVVGVVRHNVASPFLKDISNQQTSKEHTAPVKTFPFPKRGKKENKADKFKFRVDQLKKLTVPVSPSFMSSRKKANLSEKDKQMLRTQQNEINLETQNAETMNSDADIDRICTNEPDEAEHVIIQGPADNVEDEIEDLQEECSPIQLTSDGPTTDDISNSSPTQEIVSTRIRSFQETPKSTKSLNPFVFSPFPTAQKDNREEITKPVDSASKKRRSSLFTFPAVDQSPEAERTGQLYFMRLDKETKTLTEKCEAWTSIASLDSLPPEVSGDIASVTGQTKLLIGDKFEQFRTLVVRFENDEQPPVTADDLEGFWDMMYIQITKMNEAFSNFEKLKARNWVEDPRPVNSRTSKNVCKENKTKKVVAKSQFRQFLKAGKRTTGKDLKSPLKKVTRASIKSEESETPSKRLKENLYKDVLSSGKSRRKSSLAAASCSIRSSLIGKAIGKSPVLWVECAPSPDMKSILKQKTSVVPVGNGAKKRVIFGGDEIRVNIEPHVDLNATFEMEEPTMSSLEELAVPLDTKGLEEPQSKLDLTTPMDGERSQKKKRAYALTPGFTPRRSARIQPSMSTPDVTPASRPARRHI